MQKIIPTIFTLICLLAAKNLQAQFGNTPEVLTQSTNANQLGIWHADLDADGDADLLVAHLVSLIWYENDGAGNFSNDHEIMTADMVNSIGFLTGAFEDLNADGLPDLVFDKAWRRGLGNGQFAPQTTILTKTLATLCDVNSDGLPDAITLDYQKVYWQRNLGSGSFAAQQVLFAAAGSDVFNLKIDFDSDGRQDFLARHGNAFFWYKNLGNNQFEAIQLLNTYPGAIAVADLDNNGKTDFLLGTNPNLLWYEFDSSGQQTLRQTLPQYYGGELSIGDLDSDGDKDIFVGSVGTVNGHRAKYFAFDAASGQFDPVPKSQNFYLHDHDFSEIVDLNGDARPDILVGEVGGGQQLGWLENLAPGSFTGFKNINRKLALPFEIEIADLENDGDMDIFSVGIVLENLGGGQYAEKRSATPSAGSRSFSGDLDGDGVPDLALPLGDSISWRKGLGNGQFAAPKLLPGLVTSCKQVGGGDLDNDGDLDLFAANGTDAVVANARFYWFENDGAGNFTGHLLETGIQFCAAALALDANEDGLLDMGLLFFNSYSPRLYLNLGGGNFAQPTNLFSGGSPSPSNVNQDLFTDLDGDGRLDYVYCTRNTSSTKVAWYQNLGAAGFSAEKSLTTMAHQGSYAVPRFCVFDANLDGITDVVVSDNYWNRFLFVKGLGNSQFAQATTIYDEPNFGNFYGVAAHDVDGDGKLDIVYGSDTDYLYNFNGYNRLSWLKNLAPAPAPGLQIVLNNTDCHDNGTPLDATDDREIFRFKVVPNGNAAASGQFVLFDETAQIALDTFIYGVLSVYALPPGSAGLNLFKPYSCRDLVNPDLKKDIFKNGVGGCSPAAPPGIGINHFKAACDDAGTPDDPTDDRVRMEITAAKYNGNSSQFLYLVQSNLGKPESTFDGTDIGFYTFPEVFLLPPGSAAVPGQVTLTLRDSADQNIVKTRVFENPGVCSSASLAAVLSGGGEICAGDTAEMRINFIGDPPFSFVLTENGVSQPIVTTAENPFSFSVSPSVSTVFNLQNVSNAQGNGIASGSASVSVFPIPTAMIVAPDTICLGDTVVLTASGGTQFLWSGGQTTTQIEVLPTATTTFSISILDANGCAAFAEATVAVKNCTSGVFSAGNNSENAGFQVFPNPLPVGEQLQILLENEFLGTVKIEILGLDGRQIFVFETEKTTRRQVFQVENLPQGSSFFVRVSDGKASATRLISKY